MRSSVAKSLPSSTQATTIVYPGCYGNHNKKSLAEATVRVAEGLGQKVGCSYPGCCGMPQLEAGELGDVREKAERVARSLAPLVRKVIAMCVNTLLSGAMTAC